MKYFRKITVAFCLCAVSAVGFAQGGLDRFLTPSDSLNPRRRNAVVLSEVALSAAALTALGQVWYKDYPASDFHFTNDFGEWLQMDKVGHVYSSYQMGKLGSDLLHWSGVGKRDRLLYGATAGFVFMTAVEVFDGYSAEWGASWGDVAANATGTALFISQELLWDEQRIVPKFSFSFTPYPAARPEVLGSSFFEKVLKDYNGQTYWLSVNPEAFLHTGTLPKWLNIAVGYGASGMITGEDKLVFSNFFPDRERIREFYVSFDVDLTRIPTKSPLLKTLFSVFNTIKIPAPTLELRESKGINWHAFYF